MFIILLFLCGFAALKVSQPDARLRALGCTAFPAEGSFKLCFSSFAPRQIKQARLHSVWRRLSSLVPQMCLKLVI